MRAAAVVAVLTALLAAGCTGAAEPADPTSGSTATDRPDTALDPCPAFPETDAPVVGGLPSLGLPCLDGGPSVQLGGVTGTPTVVNLWASWCGPCREELPVFQQLYDAADAEELLVLGVVQRDTPNSSLAYAAELGLDFPSAIDDTGRLLTEVGINSLPLTYFLAADGTVAYRQVGPITSYDELVDLVAEHLDVTM